MVLPMVAGRSSRVLFVLALAVCAGFLLLNRRGHVDDGDGQTYQVVARHMAEDHAWLRLRYLPAVFPQFREHLPFGFWPSAATIRLFGEPALLPLSIGWALATLALVGWLGAEMAGLEVGIVAMLILGSTASFFEPGSRPRLDGPLLFFATAAAAPVLRGRPRAFGWFVATGLAALAALVKGPFGVVPLAGAVAARAFLDRSVRTFVVGTLCSVVAVLPVAAFLVFNHRFGDDSWWTGYLHNQILASATGGRTDGLESWSFPLRSIAGRFWPGLPLVALGIAATLRGSPNSVGTTTSDENGSSRAAARMFGVQALLILVALCLPSRKVWNHALIAYPSLALLAGVGCRGFVARVRQSHPALGAGSLAIVATAVWVAAITGVGARTLPEPCVVSQELSADLSAIAPESPILVLSPAPDWRLMGELAAERHLDAVPLGGWPLENPDSRWAISSDELSSAPPATWQPLRHARGWTLFARREPGPPR